MTTTYIGNHIEVTDALREFTDKKLKRLTNHVDRIQNIQITFRVDKLLQIAEGQISVPGNTIYAKAESDENMYNAIDALVDKLMRQLQRYKEKLSDHRE